MKGISNVTYLNKQMSVGGQKDGEAVGPTPFLVVANFFREDYEERALAQATHKPVCWFRYIDDTFVVWLHGTEKLERFLDHLNGLRRNIKFTMEMKRDGHLLFLYIDMYGRQGGALGYKVYRKPTHTHLYLNPESHQHPSNIQAVLSSLVQLLSCVRVPQDDFKGKCL